MIIDDIKSQAAGQWHSILTSFGFTPEQLTGKHQPCFLCGGTDRARWIAKDEQYFCNQCNRKFRDGIDLVGEINGWEPKDAIKELAEYLGIAKLSNSERQVKQQEREAALDKENKRLKTEYIKAILLTDLHHLFRDTVDLEQLSNAESVINNISVKLRREVGQYSSYKRHKKFIRYFGECIATDRSDITQVIKCYKFLESEPKDQGYITDAKNIILLHKSFGTLSFDEKWLKNYLSYYNKILKGDV